MIHFSLCATLLIAASTQAATWTVDDDSKADFQTIQAAVDAAADGDEIIVFPGTYTSTGDQVVSLVEKSILLHSNLGAAVTFIDGQNQRRGFLFQGDGTDQTQITGFTIRNCQAPWYDWNGNGNADYWEYFGGGAWSRQGAGVTMQSCRFVDNVAEYGGGICNFDEFGSQNNPTLIDCHFQNNTAGTGVGGGIYSASSSPTLTDCSFVGNSAAYGGGMLNWDGSDAILTNCTFESNTASSGGGGVYTDSSEPTMTYCTFRTNFAVDGGGVFNADPGGSSNTPVFEGCLFIENTASSEGGGIHNFSVSPIMTECTFKKNHSSSGGAILSWNGSVPEINNSIFCENTPDAIIGSWSDEGGNEFLEQCPPGCSGDVTGDSTVGVNDVLAIIGVWGPCSGCNEDIDQDGTVGVPDLLIVLGTWGPCP